MVNQQCGTEQCPRKRLRDKLKGLVDEREVSPMLAAILWRIVGGDEEPWAVHPETGPLIGLSITSDGFVTDPNIFIGSLHNFEQNLLGCCEWADLDADERTVFQVCIDNAICSQQAPRKVRVL